MKKIIGMMVVMVMAMTSYSQIVNDVHIKDMDGYVHLEVVKSVANYLAVVDYGQDNIKKWMKDENGKKMKFPSIMAPLHIMEEHGFKVVSSNIYVIEQTGVPTAIYAFLLHK